MSIATYDTSLTTGGNSPVFHGADEKAVYPSKNAGELRTIACNASLQ